MHKKSIQSKEKDDGYVANRLATCLDLPGEGKDRRTLRKRFTIGEPKPTARYGVSELKKMGMVGLYEKKY